MALTPTAMSEQPDKFITIGDLEAELRRLRREWKEQDRAADVLDAAARELERIRREREDYYGSFGM